MFIDIINTLHTKTKSAQNEQELFNLISNFSKILGFEYCCYGFRSIHSPTRHNIKIFDTYPADWMRHYQECDYIHIDPTVCRGAHENSLILWHEDSSPKTDLFWNEARDFGLNHGIAQSSWGPHGEFGLLNLGRTETAISTSELEFLKLNIWILTNYTHLSMSNFLRKPQDGLISKLTMREREILMWTAEGKTSEEIGKILGISDRTVNFHIYNALSKTESRNKIQAAIKIILFDQ